MNNSEVNAAADQHRIPLPELEHRLNCSGTGLSSADAVQRLSEFGGNKLRARKDTPEIIKFVRQLTNFFALLLIVGSALAFFADDLQLGQGNSYIGVALLAVVLLNALFFYVREYESDCIMVSFRNMLPQMISVFRDA